MNFSDYRNKSQCFLQDVKFSLCSLRYWKNLKSRPGSKHIRWNSTECIRGAGQDKLRTHHFEHFSVVGKWNCASNERKNLKTCFIFSWPCISLQILGNNQLDALFYVFVYFMSLHVSSVTALIIRRWNFINTVIPRLTKIIRSGITFVSRNVISRRFL
jgi:hypothetical protein